MSLYYIAILSVGIVNVALAAVAYTQRARQIAGNRLRERQLALARTRNRLARTRVRCLQDQTSLLREIRDQLRATEVGFPVVGVVDVGSLSVRLQVARHDPWKRRLECLYTKGFHQGLGLEAARLGEYSRETLDRVGDRMKELVATGDALGCDRLAIVVTAPGRSGSNPDELVEAIRLASGREPDLLTPEREAELSYLGATMSCSLSPSQPVVCDVGGGSTEVASGALEDGLTTASFDVGAFTLAHRWHDHWPPHDDEIASAREEAEARIDLRRPAGLRAVLATGGSARAASRIGSSILGAEELAEALENAVSRSGVSTKADRRRSLPGGILILEVLQSRLGLPLTVATGGLREGVLLQLSGVPTPRVEAAALAAA